MNDLRQPIEKTCERCGRPWLTRSSKARTCSPKCRAQLRETETPSVGRKPREYPQGIIDIARELYLNGATIAEVNEKIGPGFKAEIIIRRYVGARRAVPRDQSGAKNPLWKGADAGCQALHLRVAAARGTPNYCACCDATDSGLRYEWANLSGRYEDIRDYARMCVSCHRLLDANRRRVSGDFTSPKGGAAGA